MTPYLSSSKKIQMKIFIVFTIFRMNSIDIKESIETNVSKQANNLCQMNLSLSHIFFMLVFTGVLFKT